MMKFFLLLALVVCVKSTDDIMRQIRKNVDKYNFDKECWGENNMDKFYLAQIATAEKCYQMEPTIDVLSRLHPQRTNPFSPLQKPFDNPFQKLINGDLSEVKSLWRNRRAAASEGYLDTDEDDMLEFLDNFRVFGHNMASSISNLTCVLQEMKMLDAEGNIILDTFVNFADDEEYEAETEALKDLVFVEMIKSGYNDCYKISQNWPQQSLDRNPLYKFFGKNMVFLKCAKKHESKCCLQTQLKQWYEKLYGKDPNEDLTQYGLPENKYEAAAISTVVEYHAASPEEKFVGEFFWGME